MCCSLLRVLLAGEFTISSFLLVLMHLPKTQTCLKIAFLLPFSLHKQNTAELLGHSIVQAALSDKYNSHLVCGRALPSPT